MVLVQFHMKQSPSYSQLCIFKTLILLKILHCDGIDIWDTRTFINSFLSQQDLKYRMWRGLFKAPIHLKSIKDCFWGYMCGLLEIYEQVNSVRVWYCFPIISETSKASCRIVLKADWFSVSLGKVHSQSLLSLSLVGVMTITA